MIKDFDWVPFFEKLLSIICILSNDNIKASKLLYEYYKQLPENNYDFSSYKQIDPLTYIACVSRNIQNINKANLDFNIGIALNKKGDGIPSFDPRGQQWVYAKELFYPSTKDSPELIFDNLWDFAREINKEKLNKSHFNKLLNYNSVTAPKLSKIVFICKPNMYYPCDKNMVNYVNYKSPSNYDEFLNFQNTCKQHYKSEKPYSVSYEAWLSRDIDKNKKGKIIMNERSSDFPKNQILYGPPGTGKTYNTVLKAMSIIDNTEYKDVPEEQYSFLKTRFDELKQAGQIEFVTFHQSYSYEEFVEGIKPNLNGGNLSYKLENGIFKNICDHAKPISTTTKHAPIDFSNTKVFKMSLGNTLEKEDDIYDYCIENNVVSLGWKDIDFSNCKTSQDFKSLDNSWGSTALERFVKWMDIGDIIIISNGNMNFRAIAQVKSDYFYDNNTPISHTHFRKVEWLYKGGDIHYSKINNKSFSQQSIYGYFSTARKGQPDYNPDLKTDELNKIITGEVNKEISKPHILIIDEINRGNISKIFGELITLIEEDKRENLSVTLPYSKETFDVPKNLYIIGTMNTSDRSIASIDIALRRRFKFKEMMPDSNLVADFGIDFRETFEKLNTRIKILLDRDHQIGHSYFINKKYNDGNKNNNAEALKDIWFSEILPLLNEYFYCDWEKLKLIIPGFIQKTDVPKTLKNECDEPIYYEFKAIEDFEDDAIFEKALKQEKFEQE